MTFRKLQKNGYLKRKRWMAIYVEYAVEEAMDLSQDRLRYDDNN